MEWLLIIGLAVWLFSQSQRIGRLERRLDEVSSDLETQRLRAAPRPFVAQPPPAEPKPEPELIEPALAAVPPPTATVEERAQIAVEPQTDTREAAPEPAPRHRTFDVSSWLAENGLAWLGGGALALGGLFLVVYASQRGFFTPPMRIGAAVLAGGLMLAASEWIRRQTLAARHPLAAGAAAGAGGATLYGAIWAAQQLYHLIPFEAGALLIVLCSAGLLAYALLHGEALAVLALFGAFAAPVVTGVGDWRSPAPEAYLTAIVVTGFSFSAMRRWAKAGHATIAGALLWSLAAIMEGAPLKAALLLLAAAAGACLATGWRVREVQTTQPSAFDRQPLVAIVFASVLAGVTWSVAFDAQQPWVGVLTVVFLSFITATAVVRGIVPASAFAAPVAAACLAVIDAASARGADLTPLLERTPLALAPALIAAAGWAAGLRLAGRDRLVILAAASLGAAILATLIRFLIGGPDGDLPWLPAAATGCLMLIAAWPLARRSDDVAADRGLALWLSGAATMVLLGVAGAIPTVWEPLAHAVAAAAFSVAALRLRWFGLGQAAAASALVAFAAMLRPDFMGQALGDMPVMVLAASAAGAAAVSFAAGWALSRTERRLDADGLKTASLMIALLGAFLLIHRLLEGGQPMAVDHHLSASLRTVLVLAAALVLSLTARDDDGWLARWRLRGLLALGLAHGLLLQSLALNPWWGLGEAPLGAPVLNTLLISYLAPAGLLAAITRRGVIGASAWRRVVAVGAFAFTVLWAGLTIRHAFHSGDAMAGASVVRNEACAYVICILLAACALLWVRRRKPEGGDWLGNAAQPAGWLALAIAAVAFCSTASPWWGFQGADLSLSEALLLFLLYALAATAAAGLQRLSACEEGSGWSALSQAALATSVLTLLALATLLVRFAFHGGAMQARFGATAFETWAHSAVWAVFGLGVLTIGGLRRNYVLRWIGLGVLLVTVAKVLLFDTMRLDGMVRAGSFLALGVLLMVGALAARRLNARALLFSTTREGA